MILRAFAAENNLALGELMDILAHIVSGYSTIRLFRQPIGGEYDPAFEKLDDALRQHNPKNFPGWYWSATLGRRIGFESWVERDHLVALDFDPTVSDVVSQPFTLLWDAGTRRRRRHNYPLRWRSLRLAMATGAATSNWYLIATQTARFTP